MLGGFTSTTIDAWGLGLLLHPLTPMLGVVVEGIDIIAVGFLIPVLGITIIATDTNHGAYLTSTFSSFGVLERSKIFWGSEVCYINFEWAP